MADPNAAVAVVLLAHRRNQMISRARSHPLASLLAVVSAILIVVGRVNRDLWWGNWIAVAGIAVLVVAGVVFLLAGR
jgi:O-antigen ligase